MISRLSVGETRAGRRNARTIGVVTGVLARQRLTPRDLRIQPVDGGLGPNNERCAGVDGSVRVRTRSEGDGVAVHRQAYARTTTKSNSAVKMKEKKLGHTGELLDPVRALAAGDGLEVDVTGEERGVD